VQNLRKKQDYIKVEYAGQTLYYENKYIKQIDEGYVGPKEARPVQETSVEAPQVTASGQPINSGLPEKTVSFQEPLSAEQWSKAVAEEKEQKSVNSGIKAIIIAQPLQGISPLEIALDGTKSFSPAGKIVSYCWDFGDGDTACLPKAKNTYISMSYGQRIYVVKLTVRDEKGNIDSAATSICVTNRNL
jgi:PKD domain